MSYSSATVGNLQAKVETLTTTNALMKEDLAIARNSLMALQSENLALRQNRSNAVSAADSTNILDKFDPEMAEALADEKKKKHEIERELELQVKCTPALYCYSRPFVVYQSVKIYSIDVAES